MVELRTQPITIFISSPGDLGPERMALKQLIESLNNEPAYQGYLRFHPFLYEAEITEEDLQGMDWQQYINLYGQPLADTQLVIGMIWSRLGHELPNFVNPVTGRAYRSGTEYELFTAADAQHQHGLPLILFYQCTRTVPLLQGDDDRVREMHRQLHLAQDFVQDIQDEQIVPTPLRTFSGVDQLLRQVRADLIEVLPKIVQHVQAEGSPPISTLPALPVEFVPRQVELKAIVDAVQSNPLTVLHGLPGQGKTVMARAICDVVAQQFTDGILWATLGQQADLARVQREWILHLHGNLSTAHDTDSAHEEVLRDLIGKTVLVVLDDVWQPFDVQALITDLPASCHVLVTTRNARLLPAVPLIELGPMSSADSRELLRRASKEHVTDSLMLDAIAERLGHLALALKIVGALLMSHSWEQIRAQLASQRFADLAAGQRNVFLSMEASVRFLPPDQQQRYRELVVFPPAEPLVEAAVARLWQETAQHSAEATHYLLALLQSLALIQNDGTLHDLQRDYLAATTSNDERLAWQQSLIAGYGPAETWTTLPDDGYAWRWFAWHLAQANQTDDLRTLLLDATYLENKIAHVQSTALASDFALVAGDADLRLLDRVIALSSHILDDNPQELRNQVMGRTGPHLVQRILHWPDQPFPYFRFDFPTLPQAGGDLIRIIPANGQICRFSTDGKLLLLVSANSSSIFDILKSSIPQLWDVTTGTLRQTFRGHTNRVNACVLSPDGSLLLSASEDSTLRLWEVATGTCIHVLKHENIVEDCAFSPDGQLMVSASAWRDEKDPTLRLWEVATGTLLHAFQAHKISADSCVFSPDGRYILSGGYDGTARLWVVATGELLHTFQGGKCTAFSPDGRWILSATDERKNPVIRIWEMATGTLRHTFQGYASEIHDCLFSPDGSLVLTTATGFISEREPPNMDEMTIRLWDMSTGEVRKIGHGACYDCTFSPNGRYIVSDDLRSLHLWEVATGAHLHTFQGHADQVLGVTFSPDGTLVASSATDGTMRVWDATSRTASRTIPGHTGRITSDQFNADGTRVITASDDKMVRLWDAQTGEVLHIFEGHQRLVTAAAFSPDDQFILSTSSAPYQFVQRGSENQSFLPRDHTLRLWNVATGELVHTFHEYDQDVRDCCFSPDGRFALSADSNGSYRLWEVSSGQLLRDMQAIPSYIDDGAFAFSPDSRFAVISRSQGWGGYAYTLELWEMMTGALLRTFPGHQVVSREDRATVNACAFTPDSRFIVSASADTTLRLWDVATGELLHTFQGHTKPVNTCALTPDGTRVVSASDDTTLRLWDVATGMVILTLQGHTGKVHTCLFAPDGMQVLSASSDGSLRLWHAATGKELASWWGMDMQMTRVAWSRDGTHIVVGDEGGGVHFLTISRAMHSVSESHQR
jgi:WD40 repeat protein